MRRRLGPWQLFLLLFPVAVLSTRCAVPEASATEVAEKPVPDSTAYYDSLYAPLRTSIDTFLLHRMQRGDFSGNVLFAEKGRIIHQQSYGFTTPGGKDSLQLQHTFQLASVSKPFTAAAVLLLRERGKLSLDDSLEQYLDSFPYTGITLRHLLCHRGGLGNYLYFCEDQWPDKKQVLTNDSVLAIMRRCRPKVYYQPDQRFDYSNTGYALLASVVEKVADEPFETFMRREIFEALGMQHTFVYHKLRNPDIPFRLEGFDRLGRQVEDAYQNGVVGDKGVYSTVYDLYLFDRAIAEGKLLPASVWEEAFAPQSPDREEKGKDNYGLGWRIKQSFAGYRVVYHTGWWKGFRTYFIRNLSKDQVIVVLDHFNGPFLSIEELLSLINPESPFVFPEETSPTL